MNCFKMSCKRYLKMRNSNRFTIDKRNIGFKRSNRLYNYNLRNDWFMKLFKRKLAVFFVIGTHTIIANIMLNNKLYKSNRRIEMMMPFVMLKHFWKTQELTKFCIAQQLHSQ